MSLFSILQTLFIGPLKLLFEVIFQLSLRFVGHPGVSIVCLSLAMNILVLPLYKQADAMQEEAKQTEEKLGPGIRHIQKTFSGDEKMMILQTYYRQNHYTPANALKGSVSLLLEIPFFMAAYQFLSGLQMLNGVALGPIADLAAPDGLIVLGGITLNLLPVLMTLINVISSAIYLKGYPLKTKIQLYAMAAFFLVFLYDSPSGLVFYWTLNNVFSLVKNIFYKLKNPAKVLRLLCAAAGAALCVAGVTVFGPESMKRMAASIALGVALLCPLAIEALRRFLPQKKAGVIPEPNSGVFTLCSVFMTVLVGVMIPGTFIAASPQEYVDVSYYHNPLWYLVSSGALAAGFFLVWFRVFYSLANKPWKVIFERLVWIACGVMLGNYLFFGTDLGIVTATLQYEEGMTFTAGEQLLNLVFVAAMALVLWLLAVKYKKTVRPVILTAIAAVAVMSALNVFTISRSVSGISARAEDMNPELRLSKTGKNVVVLMLDRGMGAYVPYLFQEKPELVEQFDGFTYYSNTVSFGGYTNIATPALFGGYEYTPVEMNLRDQELLKDKHTEALKVMPALFYENGYDVTVCDPTYANYQFIPDVTVFDDYPEMDVYLTKDAFIPEAYKQSIIDANYRNFFMFSLMKTMPVAIQPMIYRQGNYFSTQTISLEGTTPYQIQHDLYTSDGLGYLFMAPYKTLENLTAITRITQEETGTFLLMVNETTHDPMLLQEPEYVPAAHVDNSAYAASYAQRFTLDGRTLEMDEPMDIAHYHANMAAMLQLGKWFDHLRESGVYDNTRIILVADHGRILEQIPELLMETEGGTKVDMGAYYPLLMVKDFNSTGFTTSDVFMTNADVPTLATQNLISDPVNPFTGNLISSDEKTAHDQYILMSGQWDIATNNGTTFLPGTWVSVRDNLWDSANWTFCFREEVLKQHSFSQ